MAVFWCHFNNAFYFHLEDPSFLSAADNKMIFAATHIFNIFINGGWWVFVFCIISGWLAWQKKINDFRGLIKALFHRYLRFVIPVFFTNVVVVIIDKTIGIRSLEIGNELKDDWLIGQYSGAPQIEHVFKSALLLNNEFSEPLWVIRYIFIGTCFIYILKYLQNKFNIYSNCYLVILICWPVGYYCLRNAAFSWFYAVVVLAGGILLSASERFDSSQNQDDVTALIGIMVIILALNKWSFDQLWNFITALLFMWFSVRSKTWQKFLESSKRVNKSGHLSFTVYLFHSPILCSVSMLIYKHLAKAGMSYTTNVIINLVLSTIILLIFCKIYYQLIQKRLDALIRHI